MANHGMAAAEAALRARKLDPTLTTALPPLGRQTSPSPQPQSIRSMPACVAACREGICRKSSAHGPSGRTTLLLQLLAAATRRGEIAAVVDTFDCLDVASAVSAGVELDRLMWIRGSPTPAALADRSIERALKALNLVLQAGGFGVVAIDFADAPLAALNRIPFTTWLRIQRTIEGKRDSLRSGGTTAAGTKRRRLDAVGDWSPAVARRCRPKPPADRHRSRGPCRSHHVVAWMGTWRFQRLLRTGHGGTETRRIFLPAPCLRGLVHTVGRVRSGPARRAGLTSLR